MFTKKWKSENRKKSRKKREKGVKDRNREGTEIEYRQADKQRDNLCIKRLYVIALVAFTQRVLAPSITRWS